MKKLSSIILIMALLLALFGVIPAQAQTVVAKGIDVSKWQGTINWSTVKASGHGDFAILQAFDSIEDENFDMNYTNAKAAGVPVGAAVKVYGTNITNVQGEINGTISMLRGKQFEYPVYVQVGSSKTTTSLVKMACQMLVAAGYVPGVFAFTSVANSLDMAQLSQYTTWIADYRATNYYTGAYDMWQYSESGSVPGITTPVDVNYCYADLPSMVQESGKNGYQTYVSYPYDVTETDIMLYDGEDRYNITAAYSTMASVYTSNKTQGEGSLKLTFSNPKANYSTTKLAGLVLLDFENPTNLSGYDTFQFDVYFSRNMNGSHGIQMNFISDTSGDGFNWLKAVNGFEAGWHTFTVEKDDIGRVVSSADWSSITRLRFSWWNYQGFSEESYMLLDNVRGMNTGKEAEVSPYPYVVDENTLMLNDGETTEGITPHFYTEPTLSSNSTQGDYSLQLSFTSPQSQQSNDKVGGMVSQRLSAPTNFSGYTHLVMDVYFSAEMIKEHALKIVFGAGAEKGYSYSFAINNYSAGWHTLMVDIEEFSMDNAHTADWSRIDMVAYTWYNNANLGAQRYFLLDNVRLVDYTKVLEAATPVVDLIAALPAWEAITLEDKEQIQTARYAYDSLTQEEKVWVTNFDDLIFAEIRWDELRMLAEKEAADKAAAQLVIHLISALPALESIVVEDKTQIEAARMAYEQLTPDQKLLVANLEVLQAAESQWEQVKIQEDTLAANSVMDLIDSLPALSAIAVEDKAQIEAVRLAYEQLTKDQKDLVTNLDVLEATELRWEQVKAKAEKDAADQAAAAPVVDLISALPTPVDITLDDQNQIETVREVYEQLTEDQKTWVTNYDVLTAAEIRWAQVKAKAEKDAADKAAATPVMELISALPMLADILPEHQTQIVNARLAYEMLTQDQKAWVTNLDVLIAAEIRWVEVKAKAEKDLADKAAAKVVEDLIAAIPSPEEILLANQDAITKARTAFDSLTEDQKAWVGNLNVLQTAEEKLETIVNNLGDVNGDGVVNAKDALEVLKAAVGKTTLTKLQEDFADVNKDGDINAKDALEILKKSVGKPACF